jgi:hypothetical protein
MFLSHHTGIKPNTNIQHVVFLFLYALIVLEVEKLNRRSCKKKELNRREIMAGTFPIQFMLLTHLGL